MDYIKIPIDSWTDSQLLEIKNKANVINDVNITDADVVVSAIDLLHYNGMINHNQFLSYRINRHMDKIKEIAINKEVWGDYIKNTPKYIDVFTGFLSQDNQMKERGKI